LFTLAICANIQKSPDKNSDEILVWDHPEEIPETVGGVEIYKYAHMGTGKMDSNPTSTQSS
jgi:hypothetical protein